MATSGQAALDFCADRRPDVILLDIVMPDMLGYVVCARLKANPETAAIPIIFVTGKTDPFDEAHALEQGGADFITKPFHARVVQLRVSMHLLLKAQSDQLRRLAMNDGLTGLSNRRSFDQTLEAEWRRCARNNTGLALIMLDVDHFKLYNDAYGHQAGDACLQALAEVLTLAFARSHDHVARYGGEEFSCILPATSFEGAVGKAGELMAAIGALQLPHSGSPLGLVSASVGVAHTVPRQQASWIDLLLATDRQLYLAKQTGRARVSAARA